MFLNITGLTEKGKEIKSSNNKKLGKVHGILKNSIIMEIEGGKREKFFLPNDLISRIHKKTVYLDLSDSEFRELGRKEGSTLVAEYPGKAETYSRISEEDLELIKKQINIAFEENFSDKQITVEVEGNTCPYCKSRIDTSDQITCAECGLSYTWNKTGYTLAKRSKAALYNSQWSLRLLLPFTVNEMIKPEEWVYYKLFLVDDHEVWRKEWTPGSIRGVLALTTQRLINFMKGGGQGSNWEIPLDRIMKTRFYFHIPRQSFRISSTEIGIEYQKYGKTERWLIKRDTKDHRGELYLLHKHLHSLNEHIADHDPSFFDRSRYNFYFGSEKFESHYDKVLTRPCPHCNKQIGIMALLCPKCQGETNSADVQLQEIDVKGFPFKQDVCPHCSSEFRISGPYCPQCGDKIDQIFDEFLSTLTTIEMNELETPEPFSFDKRVCAYCGQENLVYAEFCGKCGRKMG